MLRSTSNKFRHIENQKWSRQAAVVALLVSFCFGLNAQRMSRLPTVNEALAKLGIGLSKSEVIHALTNANSEVRLLAALKLVQDNDTDAIPALEKAAARESDDRVRVPIEGALAELGDKNGLAELERTCSSAKTPDQAKLAAVEQLLQAGHRECLVSVISIIQSTKDDESTRQVAITLLPRFAIDPTKPSRQLLDVIVQSLGDESAVVRLTAARALGKCGTRQDIAPLESAASSETDRLIRSDMTQALHELKMRTEK